MKGTVGWQSLHAQVSPALSHHVFAFTTQKLSESQYLCRFEVSKQIRTKDPLDESERGEWKSQLCDMLMDRESWRAAVHGVAKSQTWLSDWTELTELSFQETGLLIESLAIGDWSQSQWPSLSPEVQKRQNLSYHVWVFLLGTPQLYGSQAVFQKSSPDLQRRVNCKSFRRPGPWNRERIKNGQENDSQKGQGKEPGDLSNIVSDLVPQPTTQGLCFLLSLQFFPTVAPYLSISFHNRKIIIIW